MVIHILNICKMGLGIVLIFFAVILWSMFRKFSTAALALTAVLIYVSVVLDLLEFYSIIDINHLLIYKNVPVLRYIPTFLIMLFFIFTLIIFLKEEKRIK